MTREHYTHGHHETVLRSHRWRTAENSAAYLLPRLSSGVDLLDVGCGPGTITVDLAALVAPGRVVAIDSSADVLAGAVAADNAAGHCIEWRVDDAYALAEADNSFDVVHAHQVLQHLARPVDALREWGRVCRPGGIIAARDVDYAAVTWSPADPLLDRWMELCQLSHRANGGEPNAGRQLMAWAHESGFDNVEATASVWCFATPLDREYWGGMWADRIVQSALATQLINSNLSDADELSAISAAWRRWVADPNGWTAVLHGEAIITV
jgi:2-polyprenyl-3-methyl-5-hydroxy-6-metoxy-1,4-benzoquinol methylase